MNEKSTTDHLNEILKSASPEDLPRFLHENREKLLPADKPFAAYMRSQFKKAGRRQQDIFLAGDIPERYGYKIISEEKHTRQRDCILRICFGARFRLKQTQHALRIYGMAPLYAKDPRDAALIIAFHRHIYEISKINEVLLQYGLEPLRYCGEWE